MKFLDNEKLIARIVTSFVAITIISIVTAIYLDTQTPRYKAQAEKQRIERAEADAKYQKEHALEIALKEMERDQQRYIDDLKSRGITPVVIIRR